MHHPVINKAKRILTSAWLFPAITLLVLAGLTFFKISGTSISVYSFVYNNGRDPGIVFGEPRGVRSDEWLVNTQLTIAQANNDFRRINENLGEGQDMSVNIDVPYKEWSELLKPQNLAFFVMPLEYAFAFKWWLLLSVLILSCYFLILKVFPGKIWRSALISLFVGFSPYVFWWYQSITILSLAYSFIVILFTLKLFEAQSRKQRLIYSSVLAYTSACFGLLLYPPFQIPCVIVSLAFLTGMLAETYTKQEIASKLKLLWPYIASTLFIVALLGGSFYATRGQTIDTISSTVYPGKRIITAGGPKPILSLSSHLSPNLQYDKKAATGYIANQSESSNFIFIAPYLFLPSLYIIIRLWKKEHEKSWALISINILILVLLTRMYISIPPIEPLYRLLLLHKVPNTRLLLGIGLAGIFQLVLLIKALESGRFKKHELTAIALAGFFIALGVMITVGAYTIKHYPSFIASPYKAGLFSIWIALAIYLLLRKCFAPALILLVAFSFISIYKVNPLYKGLGSATNSKITRTLEDYPDEATWVVLDDRLLINFPVMAGKDSLNSVSIYPQINLWHKIDTRHKYENIYNRYAHIVFTTDRTVKDDFTLPYADIFLVKFSPCDKFIRNNVRFVLSPKPLDSQCLIKKEVVELDTPSSSIFIYEITP